MPQGVIVKEYKNRAQFQYDARRLVSQGYEVVSVTDRPQRVGLIRILMTGFLALLWKPPPRVLVTYRLTLTRLPAATSDTSDALPYDEERGGYSLGGSIISGLGSYVEWVGTLPLVGKVLAIGIPVFLVGLAIEAAASHTLIIIVAVAIIAIGAGGAWWIVREH